MAVKRCLYCGVDNPEERTVCNYCGTVFVAAKSDGAQMVDVITRNFTDYILKALLARWTRIQYSPEDFTLNLKLRDNEWTFTLVPISEYGELALKKLTEQYVKTELEKG